MNQCSPLTARELAEQVDLTATPTWRRVQKLEHDGVIRGRLALVDPAALNLDVTALVHIRTNDHSAAWLDRFCAGIADLPEIVEAYDGFYMRLIARVDLYDVRTVFVMEQMKQTTALPLDYL